MEEQPQRSPDEEPSGPEDEQLDPGEIDLTGVVRQDAPLADVIGDALAEAEGDNGTLPEWGARSMARALANERDDPMSGALHHYAITGHADPEAIARELVDLYEATTDDEIREWINWLGVHVIRMPDEAGQAERTTAHDTPDLGSSPEAFGRRLRHVFAEADARGEAISGADAQALAALLSIFLDPDSQMARFADTGDANPVELYQECQVVRHRTEHVPGADQWITYFEQHLASRSDLGRQRRAESASADRQPSDEPTTPASADDESRGARTEQGSRQAQEGIRRHGDAFHAYLSLADIDQEQDDLLQSFRTCYVGVFESMHALVNTLVLNIIDEAERARWAAEGVTLEDLARSVWDIVDINGKLYVFNQ